MNGLSHDLLVNFIGVEFREIVDVWKMLLALSKVIIQRFCKDFRMQDGHIGGQRYSGNRISQTEIMSKST